MKPSQFLQSGCTVKLDDPFPIESFRRNVRDTILSEFGGRCPSIREVFDVPDAAWMALPGIGPVTLTELRQVLEKDPPRTKVRVFEEWTDGELQAERDRLQREVGSIRDNLVSRRHRLMA